MNVVENKKKIGQDDMTIVSRYPEYFIVRIKGFAHWSVWRCAIGLLKPRGQHVLTKPSATYSVSKQ